MTDLYREIRYNWNKKHSENADTSPSVTFNLEVWPYVKVKQANVIKRRLLYCTLVPDLMSVGVILFKLWPLVHFLWPLTFACDLHHPSRSLSFLSWNGHYIVMFASSIEFELCSNFWRKHKWRHNDVSTIRFFYEIYSQIDQGYI